MQKNISNYFEVFIDTPIDFLVKHRDYKKLYSKAINKKIKNVVGIDIPFKYPKKPDFIIQNMSTKFKLFLNYKSILKKIKEKKIKIY